MTRIAPAASGFQDIPPFPGENPRIHIGANHPPIEEALALELDAAIAEVPGLKTKIAELVASAARLPDKCLDDDTAGKLGDLQRMANTAIKRVQDLRVAIKKPHLEADRNLMAKERSYTDALADLASRAKRLNDAYVAEQARIAREAEEARQAAERERQRAEWEAEQARLAAEREAARGAEPVAAPEPQPMPEPVFVAPPPPAAKPAPITTDLGTRIGTKKVWRAEPVTSLKGLPASVTGHPSVIEAANKVIAGLVRSGAREIKGVVIREHTESAIR